MKHLIFLFGIILLFAGCRSAEDAFKDAQQAELAGNNRLAVRYYLETLRLKPDMFQAKDRLAVVGQKALDTEYNEAERLVKGGRGLDGLQQIQATENLHRQISFHAPNVKIPGNMNLLKDQAQTLVRSDLFRKTKDAVQNSSWDEALGYLTQIEGYNPSSNDREQIIAVRSAVNDRAFHQHIQAAENLFNGGKYSESLSALETAAKYADNLEEENLLNEKRGKYRNNIIISEANALKEYLAKKQYLEASERLNKLDSLKGQFEKSQLDALRVLNIKLYNTWADDLFKQGKYRESWHRAADVFKFEENNKEALDLQHKALQLGRTSFALLPIITNKDGEEFTKEVDSDFNNGPARNLPPFTALVADFDLRDAFRAFRINPQRITREQALAVARRTKAQFIIFRELTAYRLEQQFTSTRNIAVQKADNSQGVMEIRNGKLNLNAKLLITIVDARSGHRLFSKEKDISSVLEFEQGFLDGPVKNYILNNQQISLLDPPGANDIQALEKSSSKSATDFFLKVIFPEMEKLVP